jgi:hypothetical protein
MFNLYTTVNDPLICRVKRHADIDTVDVQKAAVNGEFARIRSLTVKEFNYLRMLEHGVDKYTPWIGDGILVRIDKIKAVTNESRPSN